MSKDRKFKKEDQLLESLKKQLDERSSSENFAVWDADGTIWPEDANNILLDYQQNKGIREFSDLLRPYYELEGNRHKRCKLFAERQAGLKIEEFRSHCRSALEINPLHVFPFQRDLINYARQKGMTTLIVTASVKWLVEEAVKLYSLPIDKILGVETKLDKGVITSEIISPAPVAKSKGEVFLKYSRGKSCFLAGGNTSSDLPLLNMAKLPFVVHSAEFE